MSAQSPKETIFSQIIQKKIPADILFEDEQFLCFKDINPVLPTHWLLIPKEPIAQFSHIQPQHQQLVGKLMAMGLSILEKYRNNNEPFRMVINNGAGALQTVFHLHMHLLSGRPLMPLPVLDDAHDKTKVWCHQNCTAYRQDNASIDDHWVLATPVAKGKTALSDFSRDELSTVFMCLVKGLLDFMHHQGVQDACRLLFDSETALTQDGHMTLHIMAGPQLGWPPC